MPLHSKNDVRGAREDDIYASNDLSDRLRYRGWQVPA
jgi:hypothetical protein